MHGTLKFNHAAGVIFARTGAVGITTVTIITVQFFIENSVLFQCTNFKTIQNSIKRQSTAMFFTKSFSCHNRVLDSRPGSTIKRLRCDLILIRSNAFPLSWCFQNTNKPNKIIIVFLTLFLSLSFSFGLQITILRNSRHYFHR